MREMLLEFIKEIQSDKQFDSFDEAAIKQGIVLKILSFLDWDPFNMDEIHPEYDVKGGKIDFSLRQKDSNMAFIAVKKGAKALKKYEAQLSTHAAREGVKLSIVTNGITWWFSLPLLEGTQEERRFHTIDINEQKAEDIAQRFESFLSKKNVLSGDAVQAAEHIHRNRLRTLLMKESLPKAWEKLMNEPGKWLYEVLAETTKALCGHEPDRETVERFLALERDAKAKISNIVKSKAPSPAQLRKTGVKKGAYTGKSIVSFSFNGTRHNVESWKDMILKICEFIASEHRDDFEIVLTLSGPEGEYFSTNPYELLICEKIPGTEIYVDVNLSATGVVVLAHRVLSLFGYTERDLSIQTK
jgi:hypothetical protein